MKPIVLKDCLLVQGYEEPTLVSGTVLLRDGVIASVGDAFTTPPGSIEVDCRGCVVLPGNVCAHHHLYSALARGMPGPDSAPKTFLDILEAVWWRLDRAMDRAILSASGRIGLAEAALAGTTTVIDHHESPSFIDGSLEVLVEAAEEIGVRTVVCYGATDRHGEADGIAGADECRRLLSQLQDDPRSLVRGMVGAHASFTIGNRTLAALADVVRSFNTGFHIHAAEDRHDEEKSYEDHGVSVVQRLAAAGLVGPRTLLAHGVHLGAAERRTVRAAGAWVVHNPRSNRNNRIGYASADDLEGARVALGTDGIGADMFAEARHAFYGLREHKDAGAEEVYLRLAAGRRLASALFDAPFDATQGAVADLIVLERPTPTPLNTGNLPWQLVFSFDASHVRDVFIAGVPAVRDRELQGADPGTLARTGSVQAQRLWDRMKEL